MTNSQTQPRHLRILALDPGEARIGVAISDELGMFAHPRAAVPGKDRRAAIEQVRRLVAAEGVGEVLVGLPLTLEGARGPQAVVVASFVEALRAALDVPVRQVDERLTSAEASRLAPGAARKRDGTLDSLAAAVLLQSVLDGRRP